jgi:DNA polymerase III subunit epsilon
MKNKTLVFIDIETTGLDPQMGHQIIEICAIKVRSDLSRERLYFKAFPNSGVIDPVAISINGYDPQNWIGGVTQEDLAKNLGQFLDGCVPVGHNIKFDVGFIVELWAQFNINARLDRRALDTQFLAYEHLVPMGLHSLSLDNIRRFLGWSLDGSHSASKDVEDTINLFYLLLRFSWSSKLKLWISLKVRKFRQWFWPMS